MNATGTGDRSFGRLAMTLYDAPAVAKAGAGIAQDTSV